MARDAGKAIVWLNAINKKEITLYIDSGGGEVQAGLDIYDMIKHSKAPVTGIVYEKPTLWHQLFSRLAQKGKHLKMLK